MSGATAEWVDAANADDIDDHLANNRLPDASQYPTTGEFAWRGSYLAEAPADPWGNRFIVNVRWLQPGASPDRKSTRLNSSHSRASRMPSSA